MLRIISNGLFLEGTNFRYTLDGEERTKLLTKYSLAVNEGHAILNYVTLKILKNNRKWMIS